MPDPYRTQWCGRKLNLDARRALAAMRH